MQVENKYRVNIENAVISNSHSVSCACGNRTKFNIRYYPLSNGLIVSCKLCNGIIIEEKF